MVHSKVVAESMGTLSAGKVPGKAERFPWLFYIKGLAFLLIFVDHAAERLFNSSYFANMTYDWPSLADRINQLQPLRGYGILDLPVNALRYIGWNGAQTVQLFLIVSGFGLAWGLINKYGLGSFSVKEFYSRRGWRLYPMWWAAHIIFVLTYIFTGWGMSPTDHLVYLSMIGLRLTTDLLYHFTTAWWYFGVMIQLYLVFPILWEGLRRLGPGKMLILSCAVTFFARAIGIMFMTNYLDAWLRGAIFITQLAAFVFGMSLAVWMRQSVKQVDQRLRSPAFVAMGLAAYLVGTVMNFSEVGMVFSPFLRGVGLFIILYVLLARFMKATTPGESKLTWLGKHSYSLFLMHQPFILLFLPPSLRPDLVGRTALGIIAAAICAVLGAIFLEKIVAAVTGTLSRWYKRGGIGHAGLRTAMVCLLVAAFLFGVEFAVSRAAPQAVLGWGEKAALQPDPDLGWKMKPSVQVHLRFDSYDYSVTSNSLGFPGPDYSPAKPVGTFRVMVVGNAFTYASGVDTDQAWPQLLESSLAAKLTGRKVEVMNFAVAGYWSAQYATLVDKYAPIYKPDLILVAFSADEYLNALQKIPSVEDSIGFAYPPGDSGYAIVRFLNTDRFANLQIKGPMLEVLNGTPNAAGYDLGIYPALEINQPTLGQARDKVAARLTEMKTAADQVGARLGILMIPGSAQVCTPDQLEYLPHAVNLDDTTVFDRNLPQRVTGDLAKTLDLPFYDLRTALHSADGTCLYQPYNMHLLPSGHRAIANYLTQKVLQDDF